MLSIVLAMTEKNNTTIIFLTVEWRHTHMYKHRERDIHIKQNMKYIYKYI